TSKTMRSLARLNGAAPSCAGPWQPPQLPSTCLRQVPAFSRHVPSASSAARDGLCPSLAGHLLARPAVADALGRKVRTSSCDQFPWARREGLILRRLDLT